MVFKLMVYHTKHKPVVFDVSDGAFKSHLSMFNSEMVPFRNTAAGLMCLTANWFSWVM